MGTTTLDTINTLTLALAAGILSIIVARRLQLVPIVLLLVTGVVIGPEGLGWLHPKKLGETLEILLQVGIAIILFEGALTLNYNEYKKAGNIIFNLLSFGILLTWLLNAFAIVLFFQFPLRYALFLSSIIVVTGPTVIMPLLRRMNLNHNLTHILHWEGILIDPIGVFLAIFCFELLISGGEGVVIVKLFTRLGIGIIVGALFGMLGATALNRRWIPQELHNSFILMWALLTFASCNIILSESGLLAVVVAGIVLGYYKKVSLEEIKKFKLDLTEIFTAIIFILLSADLSFTNIKRVLPQGIFLICFILFVTRPLSIFICSLGSKLSIRDKLFLSWVAPRGIIAASMVTLFSYSLNSETELAPAIAKELYFMETFVFAVIAVTVVFQGTTAPFVAKALGVKRDLARNWVIVGAHELSATIAEYLMSMGKEVILLDSNKTKLNIYAQRGIVTEHGNSLAYDIFDRENFIHTGRVLAITDNMELNVLICQHWKKVVRPDGLYNWSGPATATANINTIASTAVWQQLAKPSILESQLSNQERSLLIKAPAELNAQEREHAVPLLAIPTNGDVLFSPDLNNKTLAPLLTNKWLLLVKVSFSLQSFIKAGYLAVLNTAPLTSEIVYRHVLTQVKTPLGLTAKTSRDDILQHLQEQEQVKSVCIGNQVAIFPTLQKAFTEPLVTVITTRSGVDMHAYDKKPIRIWFFIFAHNADSLRYLSLISHISKIVTDESTRNKLLAADTTVMLEQALFQALAQKNI